MSIFRRARPWAEQHYGLDPSEVTQLATYNGEVARGLVHTVSWQNRMKALQKRYDEARRNDPTIIWAGPKPGEKP